MVCAWIEELLHQVTGGAMQLNSIESRIDCVARRFSKILNYLLNIVHGHRAGHRCRRLPELFRKTRCAHSNRPWRDNLSSRRLVERVGGSTAMIELQENSAARLMDRVGYPSPGIYLRFRVDPGLMNVAMATGGRRCAFGNDQSGCGALRIIGHRHCRGREIFVAPGARHRRHDDAVWQCASAKLELSKKSTAVLLLINHRDLPSAPMNWIDPVTPSTDNTCGLVIVNNQR